MKNLTLLLISESTSAQTIGSQEYIFEWVPNPTTLIRENHGEMLTDQEYSELLKCQALWFEVILNLKQRKIIDVKYSDLSSKYIQSANGADLSDELKEKVSRILEQRIKATPVIHLFGKTVPDEDRIYYITLSLNPM